MVKRLLGSTIGIAALTMSLGISAGSASAAGPGRYTHSSPPSHAIVSNPAATSHVVVLNPATGKVIWSSGSKQLPKHFVVLNPSNGWVVFESR